MTTITILGLGEAGLHYATGLRDAGAVVRGYDPFKDRRGDGVDQRDDVAAAVRDSEVVLSLVGGVSALDIAGPVLASLPTSAVYADLNTAAPEVKTRIADAAAERGIAMADVAVLAPVPRAGHRTPLLASGDGAELLAGLLAPWGAPVEVLAAPAGEAARLRLLRSVFMKGLAALVVEGLGAARSTGAEEWLAAQMAGELGPDGAELVARLVEGTHRHAARRERELRDALAVVEASGQPADMTRAALAWLERLASRPTGAADPGVPAPVAPAPGVP